MSAPRATMRLQLHRGFTFADAARLVPYMARLCISHLYSSPILAARAGSTHGYDVIDPTRVNPELGGEAGLRDLVATLRGAGLGLIVDIVPNHMASGGMENPWWADVLQNGRASAYASFFDIDWDADDKVLAPFLGASYGEALRDGTITVVRGRDAPVIRYYDNQFPIRPEDYPQIEAAPADAFDPATEVGRERLHRLLEHQHYRLAWWRSAGDATNWRRFFDINGLVGVRVEDEKVFEATHATLFRLYRDGLIDGVRVDHVDGLADPPGYCRRLRARLNQLDASRPADAPPGPAWFVVEKILGAGERLPSDWGVDGTSGYDFMDVVAALLHDPAGEAALHALWADLSGRPSAFTEEETAARRDVVEHAFTAQLDATVAALHRIAATNVDTRDITGAAIRRALVALLAHFPVYRSYGVGKRSAAMAQAVAEAMQEMPSAYHPALELLERWLGEEATPEAAVRFQQLSAPVAAKAVEDTAYYRYGVLLSRNEVGADVRRFSMTPQEFHAANMERRTRFPDAMLATATHDHKRGEDVRARLAVLSEIPDEWDRAVRHWFALNAQYRRSGDRPMPSPGDEAMLYQMIIGAWPLDGLDVGAFAERLAGWQLKAIREAKLETDWESPNEAYEEASRSFLDAVMGDEAFLAAAGRFAQQIGPAGAVNGLVQTLLKLTVPGVPDFYQGSEFWDQSLVDPDNRRPVDFAPRMAALESGLAPRRLATSWRDGRVKQAVIRCALELRRTLPSMFARGAYEPVDVSGPRAANVVAFARSLGDVWALVVVPRMCTPLLQDADGIIIPAAAWQDTTLHLPDSIAGRPIRDVISGRCHLHKSRRGAVGELLRDFPVALLVAE
jgi:malto-oligosyltrehalose synthase